MAKKVFILVIILTVIVISTVVFIVGYKGYHEKIEKQEAIPATINNETEIFKKRFDIIHYDYSEIKWPIEVNDKLAYLVERGGEVKIIYDGKEYLKFEQNAGLPRMLMNANDKIGYILVKGNKEYFGIEGELVSKGYDSIEKALVDKDNHIYLKVLNSKKQFLVKDSQTIYPDALKSDIEITNEKKIAVFLKYKDKLSLIYNDKIYDFPRATYLGLIEVWNNKPIFILGDQGKRILVYDEQKIRDERGEIVNYKIINGELAYTLLTRPNSGEINYKYFIVYQNQLIGDNYINIYHNFGIKQTFLDKLSFIAQNRDNKLIFVIDSKEIGKAYDDIVIEDNKSPIKVGDKLAFIARENDEEFVVYNGEELPHYKTINFLTSFDNKLVFVATDKNFNSFLVIEK